MAGRFTTVGLEIVIRGLADFNRGMQTMRRQMGLTGAQTLRMSKRMNTASSAITNFGQSVRNAGNQLLILGFQMTFLASGAMASVISKASEFEQSMLKMNTLSGIHMDIVREWGDMLLDLGPELGKTPTELADALFFVTGAGYRGSEAIDVLTSSAMASSIGLGETKEVANAVTSALKAFEDQNLSAAEATDILVATVDKGKIEADELVGTFGRVIGTAKVVGITFEEVSAFLATFTRVGVDASVAVTSLRSILNNLLKPSAQALEVLESIDSSAEDLLETLGEKGLARTLLGLWTALDGDIQRFAKLIGSARGLAGALTVVGPLLEDWVEILDAIENSTGKTIEGFERYKLTTAFAVGQAKAQFESLAITIGGLLLPGVNALLRAFGNFAKVLRELGEQHPKIVLVLGALAGIVTITGPLLIVFGLLISSLGTLITAIGAFSGVLFFLLTPIGLVVAALTTLFAGIAIAVGISLDEARDKMDEKGQGLARRAFDWGKNIILQFARGMGAAAGAIVGVLLAIGKYIRGELQGQSPPPLLPDLDKWGLEAMNEWIKGWMKADFSLFNNVADTVESWIRSFAQNIPEEDLIPKILGARADIAEITEEIRRTGHVTGNTIKQLFDNIGAVNPELQRFIAALQNVAHAQERLKFAQDSLNEAQERYKNLLRPINDELDALWGRRQEIVDQMRIEELEAMLADPDLPEVGRELAMMELRSIELKKQRGEIEDQRDAELELLEENVRREEEKLAYEQEHLENIKATLEIQRENNDLIQQQIELLERLKEKEEDATEEVGEFAEAVGDLSDAIEEIEELFVGGGGEEDLGEGGVFDFGIDTESILAEIDQLIKDTIEAFKEGFGSPEKLDELQDVWSDVIILTIERANTDGVIEVAKAWIKGILIGGINGAANELSQSGEISFSDIILSIFFGKPLDQTLSEAIIGGVTSWFESLWKAINDVWTILFENRDAGAESLWETLKEWPGGIGTIARNLEWVAETAWEVQEALGNLIESIFGLREPTDNATEGFGGSRSGGGGAGIGGGLNLAMAGTITKSDLLKAALRKLGAKITGPFTNAINNLENFLTGTLIPTIGTAWNEAVSSVKEQVENLRAKIDDEGGLRGAITWLDEFLGVDFSGTIDNILVKLGYEEGLEGAIDAVESAWESLSTFISGNLTTAFNTFNTSVIDPLETAVNNLKTAVQNTINKVIELLNKLPLINIPTVLSESSPSPFARTLMNTADLMEHLARTSVPMLAGALNGELSHSLGPVTAGRGMGINSVGAVPAGTTIDNSKQAQINFGGQTINNGMDAATFQAMVEHAMRNAL